MYQFTPEKKAAIIELFKSLPVNERRMKFLEDMVDFYTEENRALKLASNQSIQICVYHPTDKSPGCAIGRWLEESENCNLNYNGNIISFLRNGNKIPEWMHEMGSQFLSECQGFHDSAEYWSNDSKNKDSKQDKINSIITTIKSNGF